MFLFVFWFFFFQAEDGIRDTSVTGVQTCALPIYRSIDDLRVAIANSYPTVTAWDGEAIIGFARATSDGVYRATIWDVVIDPHYQGAGLGRKLVQTVLSHPLMSRIERVYLMTTHQQAFYQRIGFQENQTTTMVLFHQEIEPVPNLVTVEQEPLSGQI